MFVVCFGFSVLLSIRRLRYYVVVFVLLIFSRFCCVFDVCLTCSNTLFKFVYLFGGFFGVYN